MLRLRQISLITFMVLGLQSFAGGEITPRGARSMAMGNSAVMLSDIWSAYNNQAGLIGLEGLQGGAYYHNLFSMGGLADQGFVVAFGQKERAFALNVSTFGQDVYSENRYGLAYAMKLGDKLDLGVQLNYHNTSIKVEDYGARSSLTAEIGLVSHLTDKFDLAFHLFNPSQTQLSEYEDERLPTVMSLGGSYAFNEKVILVSEVTKDIDTETILRAGIEYRIVETVYIRGGVSSEPTLSSFGAGVVLGQLDLDIAASYHNVLGYSTQLSLSYSFDRNVQ